MLKTYIRFQLQGFSKEKKTIIEQLNIDYFCSISSENYCKKNLIEQYFFQISVGEYGKIKTVDLKPNGEDIPVTNDNRSEFVNLYLEYILNSAVLDRFGLIHVTVPMIFYCFPDLEHFILDSILFVPAMLLSC